MAAMASAKPTQSQELGASTRFDILVQGFRNSGCPLLLSEVIDRELDQKWNRWSLTWHQYGKPVLQAENWPDMPAPGSDILL